MGKFQAFDSAEAISTILYSNDYDKRRSSFIEFISYIFHPRDNELRILDRDVLTIRYFLHEAKQYPEEIETSVSFGSRYARIGRLAAAMFDKKLFNSLVLDQFYGERYLMVADLVRFVLVYPDKPQHKKSALFSLQGRRV
jgi:hypothetical protein